jgi:hypothetical protein
MLYLFKLAKMHFFKNWNPYDWDPCFWTILEKFVDPKRLKFIDNVISHNKIVLGRQNYFKLFRCCLP